MFYFWYYWKFRGEYLIYFRLRSYEERFLEYIRMFFVMLDISEKVLEDLVLGWNWLCVVGRIE